MVIDRFYFIKQQYKQKDNIMKRDTVLEWAFAGSCICSNECKTAKGLEFPIQNYEDKDCDDCPVKVYRINMHKRLESIIKG